ncbi:hypothetical protein EDI_087090 [Entamoeba dispar SAW760]|uniref:Uncharacterized protein n=1 Tax=Entamoeba dispar (strain ATCC PRA-260 / SAW760) TaxID=370354 RepID=B0ELD9_ENTDS|nr:uncharacterized protein EDI_087090 [Entamoeba dispar SAW760]EDR24661.1 hypothetical protein EDI_087090 [Entamoeba dispar SAW760]|eukprot:EDR24661.1 hypothetical protein EDI_087090 [Entamoeba dispar SAW760]
MSFLSTLLSKVLPNALNVSNYAGQGIVQGIQRSGLHGYKHQLGGTPISDAEFYLLDGPIDENDASKEQVLQQHVGANKKQVVAGLIAAKKISNAVLYSPLINCKTETVTLEANLSFYYSKTAKTGTRKDGVPVINYKDHGYTHLIPKLFRNYDSLKRYDAFVLNMVLFNLHKRQQVSLELLAGNRQESSTYNRIYYVIRNVTPGRFKITRDGFEPKDATVNPNEAIPTDVLDKYDSTDMDTSGSFLSYGTLCFIKENLGENDVAMQFNIKMQFIGFRQQSLDDIYDDDGSTEMSPITTNCLPKKVLKKKNLN